MMEMSDQLEKPRRAFQLGLDIGANTQEDLVAKLKHMAFRIEREGLAQGTGVSGSPSIGSMWSYSHDPSWTKKRYFDALIEAAETERLEPTP